MKADLPALRVGDWVELSLSLKDCQRLGVVCGPLSTQVAKVGEDARGLFFRVYHPMFKRNTYRFWDPRWNK
jgi:hypothetical protein